MPSFKTLTLLFTLGLAGLTSAAPTPILDNNNVNLNVAPEVDLLESRQTPKSVPEIIADLNANLVPLTASLSTSPRLLFFFSLGIGC